MRGIDSYRFVYRYGFESGLKGGGAAARKKELAAGQAPRKTLTSGTRTAVARLSREILRNIREARIQKYTDVALRAAPGKGRVIKRLKINSAVRVTSTVKKIKGHRWYQVYVPSGQSGWIRGDLLKFSKKKEDRPRKPKKGKVERASLKPGEEIAKIKRYTDVALRATPGGNVINRLKIGTEVKLGKKGASLEGSQWTEVTTADGQRGWVHNKLLKKIYTKPEKKFSKTVSGKPRTEEPSMPSWRMTTEETPKPAKEKKLKPGELPPLGLSRRDERRLARYTASFKGSTQTNNTFNRTFEGRLKDHEIALERIFTPTTAATKKLHEYLFPTDDYEPFFFDIGPGIANKDVVIGGKGKPAITSQEMAQYFPNIDVVVVDLPSEVDIFLGKKKGSAPKGYKPYTITETDRQSLLGFDNIHILSGNGLESLFDQWNNPATNPYPDRKRPKLDNKKTIIVRAANSIDIYCKWNRKNYGSPSVKDALRRMALDFKENPVLLFFNREVVLKKAGETDWKIVGRLSNRGFNHGNRNLSRRGHPAIKLYASRL